MTLRLLLIATLGLALMGGCPAHRAGGDEGIDEITEETGGPDAEGTADGTALGYKGTLTGKVSTSVSTADDVGSNVPPSAAVRRALDDQAQAQQQAPNLAGAVITFTDLDGNPLVDENGREYPPVQVNADGSFEAFNLPIGVDFQIQVDLNGDGTADLTHAVGIPADLTGDTGSITGVDVNPLTTMAVAKLQSVLQAKGIAGTQLNFSPAALIAQLTSSFKTMFEAMGLDSTISLDQIMALTLDALAQAFDRLIPDNLKATFEMATSKIDQARATTEEDLVLAVIPALLRAGFLIMDEPGGTILDPIASLPNVEVLTADQIFKQPDQQKGPPQQSNEQNRVFRSSVLEVDRNFAMSDRPERDEPGLVVRKHALERVAGLAFAKKTLSLADLYVLATDLQRGLGMRLHYWVPRPPPENGEPPPPGPMPLMFQTANQRGVLINVFELEQKLRDLWRFPPQTEQQRQAVEAQVREAIAAKFAGTIPPTMAELFGPFVSNEPITFERLSARIRNARAHLPFNWSGPAKHWVLADRDRHRYGSANAITVDINFNDAGDPVTVVFNPAGKGKFYLRGWYNDVDKRFHVEAIIVATGRTLFNKKGWMARFDAANFAAVDGVPFFQKFAETGLQWPMHPALEIPNPWFNPDRPVDENNPRTLKLNVLVTVPGDTGEVVKVRYENGVVTQDPGGFCALEMFWEAGSVNDWMAVLVDTRTGTRLRQNPNDPGSPEVRVLVKAIQNLTVLPQTFTRLFDTEVANPMYNAEGDPWYDDINNNGTHDAGEPTFDHREELFNANDWRSTRVDRYYRRADGRAITERDVDFNSPTPRTFTGMELVPRNFKRRLNAFLFGRPNSALSLVSAFLPQDFFDGTHRLNADTRVDALGALALLNLVFDARLYNLEAYVTEYGPNGPRPEALQVVEAHTWTPPIGDPFMLVVNGFEQLAAPR